MIKVLSVQTADTRWRVSVTNAVSIWFQLPIVMARSKGCTAGNVKQGWGHTDMDMDKLEKHGKIELRHITLAEDGEREGFYIYTEGFCCRCSYKETCISNMMQRKLQFRHKDGGDDCIIFNQQRNNERRYP
jgi:hypothetical protein